jgi:hypothetical protein
MTAREREQKLSQWIKPSSEDEQTQQDRALRMVNDAMRCHDAFRGVSFIVYAKGSYANNTNVRRDSDVDIVVECHECVYSDLDSGVARKAGGSYQGLWTPQKWRTEVTNAMVNAFSAASVTKGKVALNISAVVGSRPSIDVVPSFDYYRYTKSGERRGSCVWTTEMKKIVNWPEQQLANGNAKNAATGRRYKSYVRALKNAENVLVQSGTIKVVPSYLMECLVWNVPDPTLKGGSLDYGFQETLRWLYLGIDKEQHTKWTEPNQLKWLFGSDQKWTADQAKQLVLKTWSMMGYA